MKKPYAVFILKGKQFTVSVGDVITSDRVEGKEGDTISISDVLLVSSDKETLIGQPTLEKKSVQLLIKSHLKGPKIRVAKFRAKSRYRKVRGHRQHQTQLEITAIK